MGRPTKFKDEYISEGEKYATIGLPQKDMAYIWGVDEDTITNWKEQYPDFSDALKRGEGQKKIRLLYAMFKNAEGGSAAIQIFLAKNWLGMTDKQEMEHKGDFQFQPLQVIISTNGGKPTDGHPAP